MDGEDRNRTKQWYRLRLNRYQDENVSTKFFLGYFYFLFFLLLLSTVISQKKKKNSYLMHMFSSIPQPIHSSTHPSVYPLIHPLTRLPIHSPYPPVNHSPNRPSILPHITCHPPLIHSSVHLFIHRPAYPLRTRPLTDSPIYLSVL